MQANKGVTIAADRQDKAPVTQIISAGIRPAEPADLAPVRAIAEAAYRPYVARNGLEPAPLHEDYAARITAGQLWVRTEETATQTRICGFLVLIEAADHLILDNIAVAPAAQGRGHGGAMMDFAEGYARWASLPAIRLYTQEIMVENIAIYTARGYVETHRATEYGLRRIHMEKRL